MKLKLTSDHGAAQFYSWYQFCFISTLGVFRIKEGAGAKEWNCKRAIREGLE